MKTQILRIEDEQWQLLMQQKAITGETLEYQIQKALKQYCEIVKTKI